MSEFKGKAGTIYVSKSKDSDEQPWEVWFEDFCILGTGDTKLEVLKDAVGHTADISDLISGAITELAATSAAGGELR